MPLNESNSQEPSPVRGLDPNTRVGEVDSTINIFKQPYPNKIRLFQVASNGKTEYAINYAYHRNVAYEKSDNYFIRTAAFHIFHYFIRPVWGRQSEIADLDRFSVVPEPIKALLINEANEVYDLDVIYKNIINKSTFGNKLTKDQKENIIDFIKRIRVYLIYKLAMDEKNKNEKQGLPTEVGQPDSSNNSLADFANKVLETAKEIFDDSNKNENEIELISNIVGIWLREYIAFSSISIKVEPAKNNLRDLLVRKGFTENELPEKFVWTLINEKVKKGLTAKGVFNAQAKLQPSSDIIDKVRFGRGGHNGSRYLEGPNTISGVIIGAGTAITSANTCYCNVKSLLNGKFANKKLKGNQTIATTFAYDLSLTLRTKAAKVLGRFPIVTVVGLLNLAYTLLEKPKEKMYFLDPCAGWGDRYLGHILYNIKYAHRRAPVIYYGCDPNPEMGAVYQGLSEVHAKGAHHNIQTAAFEDAYFDEALKFDVVFTSPPYPTSKGEAVENYSDSKDDSHHRYKTLEDWENGFLKTLVERCLELVSDNGLVIININDTEKAQGESSNKGPIGKMINFFKQKGAVPEAVYGLRRGPGRYEPIFIFRKQASLAKELRAGDANINHCLFPNNPEVNRASNQAEQISFNESLNLMNLINDRIPSSSISRPMVTQEDEVNEFYDPSYILSSFGEFDSIVENLFPQEIEPAIFLETSDIPTPPNDENLINFMIGEEFDPIPLGIIDHGFFRVGQKRPSEAYPEDEHQAKRVKRGG
jgi:hypothetical protein